MRTLITQYRGLPRPIYLLFVSRIVDASGCMVFPLVTMILTRKLGLSEADAGIAMAAVSGVTALGLAAGGKLADLIGRKLTILLATGLGITCYTISGLVPLSPWTLPLMVAGMTGLFAAGPAHDALVADLVPPDLRQKAYSFLYLGWNLGFAVGPAIGGFLLARRLSLLFLGDAATALAGLVIIMAFVPEPRRMGHAAAAAPEAAPASADPEARTAAAPAPEGDTAAAPAEVPQKRSISSVVRETPVLIVLAVVLLGYSLAYSQWGFLLPIHISRLFQEPGSVFGVLASINGVTVIVFSPILTLLFRKAPHSRVILLGGLFYAAGFGLFSLAARIPVFYVLAFVFTLGEISCAISTMPFIMSRTPASHRGRMAGAAQLMIGSGNVLGPILVGWILSFASAPAIWAGVGCVALAAAAVMFLIGRAERRARGVTARN